MWNRPGNVHDSHNAAGFLRILFGDLRARFGLRLPLELRMDGAFFHPEILAFLDGEPVEYAVKVPLWKWLGLLPVIASRRRWTRVDAYVEGFATTLHIDRLCTSFTARASTTKLPAVICAKPHHWPGARRRSAAR